MKLFKGLVKIALSPLNGVKEIIEDVSGNNSEGEQAASICSLGITSAAKGIAKAIKSGTEDIFEEN